MEFDSEHLGSQGLSPDDLQYVGSRYSEIRRSLFHNAYYLNWGSPGESPLPVYGVSLKRVLRGALPGGSFWRFTRAAGRAVDSHADMRWSRDNLGYRRLLHPNGVCLFGRWIIDTPTEYSGYFQQGSDALIVGRYSACCTEVRPNRNRSLSLVGKLFPTTDPDHPTPLKTANFITQEDLGGSRSTSIREVVLRNAPDTTPWRRGIGLPILLVTGLAFKLTDREPTIRQLYSIAELGKPAVEATRAPKFMQLQIEPGHDPRPIGNDFRDEVLGEIYDRGDPAPRRALVFSIEVNDDGRTFGKLLQRRRFAKPWRRIGRIEFYEAVASYNGDFVIHFHHPPWRDMDNDPNSVVRKSGLELA